MRVVATPEAREFIAARGGVAYVRSLRQKCCGGALTVLSATTTAPADAVHYEPVGDPELGVRYWRETPARAMALAAGLEAGAFEPDGALQPGASRRSGDEPRELLIELRGRRRPRLVAYWDGCAFKI